MAESPGELELYNQWFTIADVDRDGVVSGREAVAFFRRSGLPQTPTLFDVWQLVAGDRPHLSRPEFYTAMKLVSLAQRSNGRLDKAQGARLVNGLSGPVPPPTLQGLPVPASLQAGGGAATGGLGLGPGSGSGSVSAAGGAGAGLGVGLGSGSVPAAPAAPAPASPLARPPSTLGSNASLASLGAFPDAPVRPPAAASGGAARAGSSSASRASSASAPASALPSAQWPPLDPTTAARHGSWFDRLDADRDGYLGGSDVFGAFMSTGLPKPALKRVWDLVAGDAGRLSRHQFVSALYLIDRAKAGTPLPAALPEGNFPPLSDASILPEQPGLGQGAAPGGGAAVPPVPPRAAWTPPEAAAPTAAQADAARLARGVPTLDAAALAALPAHERERLEAERLAAASAADALAELQRRREEAAARQKFFTSTLADLRLTQSRLQRAVAEAEEREAREAAAADEAQRAYDDAYASFSAAHAAATPAVEAARAAAAKREEAEARKAALEEAVRRLETLDPDWERREAGEAEQLRRDIAALEAKRASLLEGAKGAAETRDRWVELRKEAERETREARDALEALEADAAALKASPGAADAQARLEDLLVRAATVYNDLHRAAKRALLPLPQAAMATVRLDASAFAIDELAVGGAADWGTFKDAGFRVVAALPADTRLHTHELTTAAAQEDEKKRKMQEEGLEEEEEEEEQENDATEESAMAEDAAADAPAPDAKPAEGGADADAPAPDAKPAEGGADADAPAPASPVAAKGGADADAPAPDAKPAEGGADADAPAPASPVAAEGGADVAAAGEEGVAKEASGEGAPPAAETSASASASASASTSLPTKASMDALTSLFGPSTARPAASATPSADTAFGALGALSSPAADEVSSAKAAYPDVALPAASDDPFAVQGENGAAAGAGDAFGEALRAGGADADADKAGQTAPWSL